jgi:hypothetical protein
MTLGSSSIFTTTSCGDQHFIYDPAQIWKEENLPPLDDQRKREREREREKKRQRERERKRDTKRESLATTHVGWTLAFFLSSGNRRSIKLFRQINAAADGLAAQTDPNKLTIK